MKKDVLRKWQGPFVAIVTPFDQKGRIVAGDFKILVESFIEDGARGIIVAGHNGESWALKVEEMKSLVSLAVETANGRVPVLCGVEARRSEDVIDIAESVVEAGAQGIMVEPPYIVTTATDSELINRFEHIADKSPVPVMLYNNPRRNQINLSAEVLSKLAKHENIAAIKESTRDLGELTVKIELAGKDLNIFVGPSTLIFPGLLLGAKGFISSGPMELLRKDGYRLYELAVAGKVKEAIKLHFKVTRIYRALMGIGTWPAALKASLNALGRPAGIPRKPVHPLSREDNKRLIQILQSVGVLS
jgi:4-hydroxy-tetrahydrodipicolinate synthase